jgi:hypothetical protein
VELQGELSKEKVMRQALENKVQSMEKKISQFSTTEVFRLMPTPQRTGPTNDSLKSRMDGLENSIFNMRVDFAGNGKSN